MTLGTVLANQVDGEVPKMERINREYTIQSVDVGDSDPGIGVGVDRAEGSAMSKLSAFIEAEQKFDNRFILGGNGLCPNRILCMTQRLNVRLEALVTGHKCAFEEHDALWQCHLSGVPRALGTGGAPGDPCFCPQKEKR